MKHFNKIILILLLQLVIGSCKGQSRIDSLHKWRKLAAEEFLKCVSCRSTLSCNQICIAASKRFKHLYSLDSTSKSTFAYIADCFRLAREYDSAITWYKPLLLKYKDSASLAITKELIADCYIYKGNIDSSKSFIINAYSLFTPNKEIKDSKFCDIWNFARNLLNEHDSISIGYLKSKNIDPFSYACKIIKEIEPYKSVLINCIGYEVFQKEINEKVNRNCR